MQETQAMRFQLLDWEDNLEKEMAPAPVLLPGKFHGQRSLVVGYHPWGCKELNLTQCAGTGIYKKGQVSNNFHLEKIN